AYDKGVAL
ncbi:hypothetical protein D037_1744B, partial [Vibrio parahaemolyticus IDH02640]